MGTSARIDELRKKFDENPRRYFAPLANEYRKAGDLEQAIFICQEYLPQQPGHMSGHIVYGQALYESGRDEEAKAVFETALSLDPENLIALRHLGDIARSAGDPVGARAWYQRVLDADPRNEEIIELLTSMDSATVGGVAAADRRTPLRNDVIEEEPEATAAAPRAVAEPSEGSVIEKSQEAIPSAFNHYDQTESAALLDEDALHIPPLPPSHPAPAAATTSDDDLLDLEDFSLGGIGSGAPTQTAPAQEPTPVGLDGDVTISGGFTLGTDADLGQFDQDSFATAASVPSPDVELAADINLGLTDESAPPTESAETPSLDGLQTFEAGVIPEAPAEVQALETEAFFDLEPTTETPASSLLDEEESFSIPTESHAVEPLASVGDTSENAPIEGGHDVGEMPAPVEETADAPAAPTHEPSAAEPEEAFVTETMAELYIQQGHLDSALDIYRKLIELHPENSDLQVRFHAIEDRMFGAPASAPAVSDISPPPFAGPTIREFLARLAARRLSNGAGGSSGAHLEAGGAGDASSVESRMTPASGETVAGSIDALFSGAHASVSDVAAADALAAAFAGTAPDQVPEEPPPLPGTPAHRAHDELSLDHVFKANTPPRDSEPTNGFSFDQFFADEMTDASADSAGDTAPGSTEATDDIAQFNAWLNGLKKT